MGKIKSFQELEVWKTAHQLALAVYRLTNAFPPDEKYGLVSQMRRAAVSVPANIAGGLQATREGREDPFLQHQRVVVGGTQVLFHPLQGSGIRHRNRPVDGRR